MKPPLLQVENLSFSYGYRQVLERVSFALEPGCFLGVLGPSGCGKSTLLGLISGFLEPKAGTVLLHGSPVGRIPVRLRARQLAHVSQTMEAVFPYRVRELAAMGRYPFDEPRSLAEPRILKALEDARILDLAERRLDQLSGGELQRALIARAFATEAGLMLLDEPTAALDLGNQVELLTAIKARLARQGASAVVVLHDLNLAAAFSDRLLLLDKGMIQALGRPEEVLKQPLLEQVYGTRLEVRTLPSGNLVVVPLLSPTRGNDRDVFPAAGHSPFVVESQEATPRQRSCDHES